MKYIIAIISCEQEPYLNIENEGVRKTWAGVYQEGVEILYYYGRKNNNCIIGDKVFLDCEDSFSTMPKKAMLFFEKILQTYKDFEYVYFTNLSSYVRLDKIINIFKGIDNDKFYSGVIGYLNGVSFASGAGFFISRYLLDFIVKNKDKLNQSVMGDVAYGELLTNNGIKIVPQKRFDIISLDHLNQVCREDVINHYHFRCKQESNRGSDIVVMRKIHHLLGY